MDKRKSFLLLGLALLCLLVGCSKGERLPEWVREEDADLPVRRWGYFVAEGAFVYSSYEVGENKKGTRVRYSPEAGPPVADEMEVSADPTALPVSALPKLAAALQPWMDAEDADHAADYNVSFMAPRWAFIESVAAAEVRRAVCSLSDGAVAYLEGDYEGTQEYGALMILYPEGGGGWYIAIDD